MNRIEKLLTALKAENAQGAVLQAPENMRYFSGYTGEGMVVVGEKIRRILTDSRYTEQATKQAPGFEVIEYTADYPEGKALADTAALMGISCLGYEDAAVTVASFDMMQKALPSVSWIAMADMGMRIRAVKDEGEMAILRKACTMTDEGYEELKRILRPGISELDVVAEIQYFFRKKHHVSMPFCIVASGVNGSMPHAIASEKLLEEHDAVTVDFGCTYEGYNSDMTRTFALGKLSPKMEEVYNIVLDAQLSALAALKPGLPGKAVDKVARDVIAKAGYGQYFGHGLGHGVGLMVHEAPRLSVKAEMILEPGMVVTVEPGIYLPGIGGVRIEDTCLVTETGCEVLFAAPKALL